jgi:proline iminopeptidase
MHAVPLVGGLVALCSLAGCAARPTAPVAEGYLVTPDSARLYYRVQGRGRDTVLVLHGGPGIGSSYLVSGWSGLEPGRTLIYYDQRGRGRSDAVQDTLRLTLRHDVDDLEAVRARFRLDRMTIAAHHWGATLAALYARRHPDRVGRLLLVSPSFPKSLYLFNAATLPNDTAATAAFLAALAARRDSADPRAFCERYWGFVFSPIEVTDRALLRRLAPSVCDAPPDRLRTMFRTTQVVVSSLHGLNLRDTLASVTAPTLILQGRGDLPVLDAAEAWTRWLPHARKEELPEPTLFPWLGDGRRFVEDASTFLRGAWPAHAEGPAIATATSGTTPAAAR